MRAILCFFMAVTAQALVAIGMWGPEFAVIAQEPVKELILPGESFLLEGRPAFVLLPEESKRSEPQPWIMYAPTLPGYPDSHERWMHQQFLEAGIAVAGIDAGEAYGSPRGQALMTALYRELTEKRSFAARPCLLGRSRGGLWAASWASAYPDRVAGLAAIYPVFDLRTYPGVARAAEAYEMTAEQLEARLKELNPIARIDVLARAHVPVCIIHGDEDTVVPLQENSATLAERYREAGAAEAVRLIVAEGQGHNFWEGFFRCRELVDFAIERARSGAAAEVPGDRSGASRPQDPVGAIAARLEPTRLVSYKRVGERELRLHVFEPDGWRPGDGRPCFLIFHGGGWTGGEPRRMYPFAEHFARQGLVGISAQYRLLNAQQGTTVFDCVEDGRDAVRFLRQHAESLGIDPARIIVSGASAGGHIAMGTSMFPGLDRDDGSASELGTPNALVLLYPVIDTSPSGYGNAKIGARWQELSPAHQVRGPIPPTMIFHGSGDTVTPLVGAEAFCDAMSAAGNRCELHIHSEGKHGYLLYDESLYHATLREMERFLGTLGLAR